MKPESCAIEGCPKNAEKKGWCYTHYSRWYRTGTTQDPLPRTKQSDHSCELPDCEDPASTRGLCAKHASRWYRHGDVNFNSRPTWGMPLDDRFWSYVDKRGPHVPDYPELGPCWVWRGSANTGGYASFSISASERRLAHTLVYEWTVGPVPEGLRLNHLCHAADIQCRGGVNCAHRMCVNPAHLEPITAQESARRGRAALVLKEMAAERTHCRRGHPLTPDNLYFPPNREGQRQCRECRLAAILPAVQRRSKRLREVFVEYVDTIVLADRDSWICGICKTPIDPDAQWPDRGYRTIDHVVPISLGGVHSYANTRIAHHGCNSARGAARGEDLESLLATMEGVLV